MTRSEKVMLGFYFVWGAILSTMFWLVLRQFGFAITSSMVAIGVFWGDITLVIPHAIVWHIINSRAHRSAVKRLREQGYLE